MTRLCDVLLFVFRKEEDSLDVTYRLLELEI